MLRIAIIVLAILLAIRLAVRLAQQLIAAAGSRTQSGRRPGGSSSTARASSEPRQLRQLVECPACGTFFEADRGLLSRRRGQVVCSADCAEPAHAAAGEDRTHGAR